MSMSTNGKKRKGSADATRSPVNHATFGLHDDGVLSVTFDYPDEVPCLIYPKTLRKLVRAYNQLRNIEDS